jgi:hypothetical protein
MTWNPRWLPPLRHERYRPLPCMYPREQSFWPPPTKDGVVLRSFIVNFIERLREEQRRLTP